MHCKKVAPFTTSYFNLSYSVYTFFSGGVVTDLKSHSVVIKLVLNELLFFFLTLI